MTTVSCPGNFSEPLLSMIENMLRSYDVECVRHGKDDNADIVLVVWAPESVSVGNGQLAIVADDAPSAVRKLMAHFGKQLPNDFSVPAHYLLRVEECGMMAGAAETIKEDPHPVGDEAVNDAGVSAPQPEPKAKTTRRKRQEL